MSNHERYIEYNSDQLLGYIEFLLISTANRIHDHNEDPEKMFFGGIEEDKLTGAERALPSSNDVALAAAAVDALSYADDPFNDAAQLSGEVPDITSEDYRGQQSDDFTSEGYSGEDNS